MFTFLPEPCLQVGGVSLIANFDTISPTLCASYNSCLIDVGEIALSGCNIVQEMPVLRPSVHPGSLSLITLLEKGVNNDLSKFRTKIDESDSLTACASLTNPCVEIAKNYNFVIFMYSLKSGTKAFLKHIFCQFFCVMSWGRSFVRQTGFRQCSNVNLISAQLEDNKSSAPRRSFRNSLVQKHSNVQGRKSNR
ncbi:hypothetical protein HELRODRAFT_158596 [Helobdella robusta]|uniref:Uncharacterized protein n=1 Tax=Helobdella robusta TaxID=6412 RepID=T1EMZ9_HELRO|nr:hypothetical protein HELRODRAFT_158596 [Helobdella robusta]ESO12146.1 hypothetical protein HELRODRAFT_158596 [Helobdella robusta]